MATTVLFWQGNPLFPKLSGSLGPSLRGKAPIFGSRQSYRHCSVGFLTKDINSITYAYQSRIELISLIVLVVGLIGSVLIARNVRSSIHGLEPKEIGELYTEKQAILQTIREGIIAVNRDGIITMVNRYALQLLQLPLSAKITGRHIEDMIPNTRLNEVVRTGKAEFDHEMLIGDHEVIVIAVPIMSRKLRRHRCSFELPQQIRALSISQELSQVKRFAEALRAQTHEFSNKLYVISGLIQLESYQEAVETYLQGGRCAPELGAIHHD